MFDPVLAFVPLLTRTGTSPDGSRTAAPPANLTDALHTLAVTYPHRVAILPTAWRSATEAAAFQRPARALELMLQLGGPYWTALQDHGDTVARRVFSPDTYASRESRTVERRPSARARRTFDYDGQWLVMWRHLKLGSRISVAMTWRLHFAYDAGTARVVIGHCGRHLDFA